MLKENKLKAKMVELGISAEELSKKIGIDRGTFYRKLKNNSFFVKEVEVVADTLKLTPEEVSDIFFA